MARRRPRNRRRPNPFDFGGPSRAGGDPTAVAMRNRQRAPAPPRRSHWFRHRAPETTSSRSRRDRVPTIRGLSRWSRVDRAGRAAARWLDLPGRPDQSGPWYAAATRTGSTSPRPCAAAPARNPLPNKGIETVQVTTTTAEARHRQSEAAWVCDDHRDGQLRPTTLKRPSVPRSATADSPPTTASGSVLDCLHATAHRHGAPRSRTRQSSRRDPADDSARA